LYWRPFAEVAFQSFGVSSWEARDMARKFAADPAWLLDISPDSWVNVQEVELCAGRALLIEELDEKGAVKRATVIRMRSFPAAYSDRRSDLCALFSVSAAHRIHAFSRGRDKLVTYSP